MFKLNSKEWKTNRINVVEKMPAFFHYADDKAILQVIERRIIIIIIVRPSCYIILRFYPA